MDKNILSLVLEMNNQDILKALYKYRENECDSITPEFKEELRMAQERKKCRYKKFEEALKKYVNDKEKVTKIINLLDIYEDEYNNEHGLYYEQYYKAGVKDMMKLILQCLL